MSDSFVIPWTICSPPGSSVHGFSQARILEGVTISFSRRSSATGIEPRSPTLQTGSLPLSHQGMQTCDINQPKSSISPDTTTISDWAQGESCIKRYCKKKHNMKKSYISPNENSPYKAFMKQKKIITKNSLSNYLLVIKSPWSMVKQITSPGWMHETSARAWCPGKTQRDRVEREGGGGIRMGNTCISMADSCQCMTKTTTIL